MYISVCVCVCVCVCVRACVCVYVPGSSHASISLRIGCWSINSSTCITYALQAITSDRSYCGRLHLEKTISHQAYKPAHTLGSVTCSQCPEAGVDVDNSCSMGRRVPGNKCLSQVVMLNVHKVNSTLMSAHM